MYIVQYMSLWYYMWLFWSPVEESCLLLFSVMVLLWLCFALLQTFCGLSRICFGYLIVLLLLWLGSVVLIILTLLCRCCSSVLGLLWCGSIIILLWHSWGSLWLCCGSVFQLHILIFWSTFCKLRSRMRTKRLTEMDESLYVLACQIIVFSHPQVGSSCCTKPCIHKSFKIMHQKMHVLYFFSV